MNLADVISRHARERPEAPAVITPFRSLDYRALDRAIWRAAAALRAQGVLPGDVVAFAIASNALHVVAGYALARIGAVHLGMTPREPLAVRAATARRFGARFVLATSENARLSGIPLLHADERWMRDDGAAVDESLRAPGGDMAWRIVSTSGTTAEPKAVLQSHAMHVAWREINQKAVPLSPAERYLVVVQLDFFAGFRLCTDVHWAGGAVILEPKVSPPDLLAAAERHAASYLYLTPMHLNQLLPLLPAEGLRLPALRLVRTGSMTVSERLRRQILKRLTPNLLVAYGTNEFGSPFTTADAATLQRLPDSIGFPVPGVEVQIVDDAGRLLPPGEVGLVRTRAAGMPREYIGNPEASARAFRDGWYYPGDLGALSAEGALYHKGRADDLMNFDGIKIYPSEIEAALLAHEDVLEAAAFPVRHRVHQQVPAAAVVLREGAAVEPVKAHCRALLGVRAPRMLEALDALPRNAAGKVLKGELARMIAPPKGGA